MPSRGWVWAALGAVAVLPGLVAGPPGGALAQQSPPGCHVPQFAYKHGTVTFAEHGRTVQVRVEIADSEPAREVGLMCRTSLDPDAGMLFVFEDQTSVPFWMKDTLIPLSIAFLDSRWRIVALMDMKVAPDPDRGPFEYYGPKRPYRYALEVNEGFFARYGLDEKAEVRFSPEAARGAPAAARAAGRAAPDSRCESRAF